ncbi:oligoribonuclease [candidate division WWE3 bacterium]|nr:oligoribonuclease [candidate division WWE3 bacterium]
MTHRKASNLVWMDLEMTGLDPFTDRITEIACLITNENLEVIAEGPEIIIKQEESLFDVTNPFMKETFFDSGFIEKMKESSYTEESAEKEILEFIKKHVAEGESPLCGNSIYMDRMFLKNYMKKLDSYLHYRLIDITTTKLLAQRWFPEIPKFEKKKNHRALEDIKESIAELEYYRKNIFRAQKKNELRKKIPSKKKVNFMTLDLDIPHDLTREDYYQS